MFKAILLQTAATLIVALGAAIFVGTRGAVSAVLGGTAVVVPNLLFAVRMKAASVAQGGAHAAIFLVGVFAKLTLTLALLFIVSHWYRDLHWLSLLAGLFLALQSNVFALLMKL